MRLEKDLESHESGALCLIWCVFPPQRFLLWERRNVIVRPFGETVQQVYARISALRDALDGPQVTAKEPSPSPSIVNRVKPA